MHSNDTRNKLKNIVIGTGVKGATDNCTATRNILCGCFSTSTTVKKSFENKAIAKKEQAGFLKSMLWKTVLR
jgi:hypothetical protein